MRKEIAVQILQLVVVGRELQHPFGRAQPCSREPTLQGRPEHPPTCPPTHHGQPTCPPPHRGQPTYPPTLHDQLTCPPTHRRQHQQILQYLQPSRRLMLQQW